MPKCLDCLSILPVNCIKSEDKYSFEQDSLADILKQLDESKVALNKLLTAQIDKKWITSDHEYITEYIQDIINKIDVVLKTDSQQEPTYTIVSSITGQGAKTSLQMFTIIVRELEALKNKSNSVTSSLYTPNV